MVDYFLRPNGSIKITLGGGINMFKRALFVICSVFFLLIVHIATAGEPHYALNANYARDQAKYQGVYPRISFIPVGFLLYNVAHRDNPEKIDNSEYLSAITQDGVEVFVLKSEVSRHTFRKNFPKHEIIFNSSYSLCRAEGCDPNVEGNTWEVRSGEALKIVTDYDSESLYKLSALRGEEIFVYINKKDLNRLETIGYVTRADMHHPNYHIQRKEAKTSGTQCGEVRKSRSTFPFDGDPGPDKLITIEFGLGTANDKNVTYTQEYGGNGKKFSFFVYDITNNRTQERYQIVAMVEYACEKEGLSDKLTRIELVQLKNLQSGKFHSLNYDDYKPAEDLFKYTRVPYLFSVNNYTQYTRLLARLGEEFGNRSLAGYFLSEFNISCDIKHRRAMCGKHDY
jgi:hypothetical protein